MWHVIHHLILHCCLPRLFPIFSATRPQKTSLSKSFPCLVVISVTMRVNSSSSSFFQWPTGALTFSEDGSSVKQGIGPTSWTNFTVYKMITVPVPTVSWHTSHTQTNFFPSLSKICYRSIDREYCQWGSANWRGFNTDSRSDASSDSIHFPCCFIGWWLRRTWWYTAIIGRWGTWNAAQVKGVQYGSQFDLKWDILISDQKSLFFLSFFANIMSVSCSGVNPIP